MHRLQRRHAGKGHGVVLLGSPSQMVGRDNHCGMFAFGLWNGPGEVTDWPLQASSASGHRAIRWARQNAGTRTKRNSTNEKRAAVAVIPGPRSLGNAGGCGTKSRS
jgi:hypothetical protein